MKRIVINRLLAFLLVPVMLFSLAGCSSGNVEKYKAKLYFLNANGTKLEVEEREIVPGDNAGSLANVVLSELLKGPTRPELKRSVPEGTKLLAITATDGLATVNFSKEFSFKEEVDSIFARVAVASTLTDLPEIERVKIMVDGKDLRTTDGDVVNALSRDDIVYDSQLVVADYKYVKLYFANKDADGLVAESRTVAVNSKDSMEYVLVSELIKGPESDYAHRTVPEETKILSVETKEGTCFVNLSQEFKTKHWGGSAGETMTIYSIVDTLTELNTVDKVQFLIEGKKVDVFIHYIFNEPFERDESLIVDSEKEYKR